MTWAAAHNGGLSQVGLNGPYGDVACLNLVKHSAAPLYVNTNKGVDPLDLNSDGYLTVINNGGMKFSFYVPEDGLLTWASRYVITWTGTSPAISVTGGTVNSTTSNRIEFTPTQNFITLSITAANISALNCFYKPYESLVNAGQIWDPQFLSALQAMKPGVLRFMDMQNSNGTSNQNNVTTWATRKPLTYIIWATDELRSSLRYNGTVSYALNGSSNDYSINLGAGQPTDKQTIIIPFPNSATNGTCTFSVDNGVTKYQILRPFGDALTSSTRWPVSGTFGTLIFDADLQGWLKWGGDGNQLDAYLQNGLPYEAMVDLAATVGAHPYFTLPVLSLDPGTDFASGLSQYCRDNGPSWFVPRFEGPNEQWATTSTHFVYSNAKQLVHNGGAIPNGSAISFNATGLTYPGSGGAGTANITIGANTLPIGASVLLGTYGGVFGGAFNGGTGFVTINTGTVITVNISPAGGTYTSGGTVAPTTPDHNSWYGMAISKAGQAISTVYGADRTKYQVLVGVQTHGGTSNATQRLASTFYVLNSGNAGNAAKNWVTHIAPASYVSPNEWASIQEILDGFAYNVTNSGNATAQAALAEAYAATLLTAGNGFTVPEVATLYASWKTFAQSFGVNNMTCYEGEYSPDYATADATAAITAATKDALGCVLTVPNTIFQTPTGGTASYSNTTLSAFAKTMTVSVASVGGMTQLNGNTDTVIGVGVADGLSANQIRINVDSSGFTTYTSGGLLTLVNSHVNVNLLRYASKFAVKGPAYIRKNYKNFTSLSGSGFVAEFPSKFIFSLSSKTYNQTGNIGDVGGVWGAYDPSVYGAKSTAVDGIRLFNTKKRRMIW